MCFCDDIGLLSCDPTEFQQLLLICEKYANEWGLEFNIPKCKIMIFGRKKPIKNKLVTNLDIWKNEQTADGKWI